MENKPYVIEVKIDFIIKKGMHDGDQGGGQGISAPEHRIDDGKISIESGSDSKIPSITIYNLSIEFVEKLKFQVFLYNSIISL